MEFAVDDALDELYAAKPEEFTALRHQDARRGGQTGREKLTRCVADHRGGPNGRRAVKCAVLVG